MLASVVTLADKLSLEEEIVLIVTEPVKDGIEVTEVPIDSDSDRVVVEFQPDD